MREIKFRGVRSDKLDDVIVYGSLLKFGNKYFIAHPTSQDIFKKEPRNAMTIEYLDPANTNPFLNPCFACALYPVHEKTIQQFCGYDDNGEEVYEGDIVTDGELEYVVGLDDVTLYFKSGSKIDHAPIYNFIKKQSR
jgi:hypothetical protein